jgi:replicative DNA helicase
VPIPSHLVDAELEKSVLGKFTTDPAFIGLSTELSADDFVTGAHKLIFTHIVRLHGKGAPVTTMSIYAEAASRGHVELVGGLSYLTDLDEHAVRAHDIEHCIGKLREKTLMRTALAKAYEAVTLAESPGSTLEDLAAFEAISRIADSHNGNAVRLRTVRQVVEEYPGGINGFLSPMRSQDYVRFPWTKAQESIGGLWPGEVMILGGRPASGKSAAALQLARYNTQFGIVPAIFNLEMSDAQTIYRSICSRAGVSMAKFRIGAISEFDRQTLHRELMKLAGDNVLLCDQPTLTIAQIRSALRKAVRMQGVNMAIIDFLQLAEAGLKLDNRQQEVSHISRNIKLCAMECKIPIVALAQLSRKNEDQHREPALSDLRESGSIEQDADVVMFTHRKVETALGGRDSYKLLFKKVRNGPDGGCGVYWDARALEFRDLEVERREQFTL